MSWTSAEKHKWTKLNKRFVLEISPYTPKQMIIYNIKMFCLNLSDAVANANKLTIYKHYKHRVKLKNLQTWHIGRI